MFDVVSDTWNPITGCLHGCRYCWARKLATTRLKSSRKYRGGFTPKIHLDEFKRRFKGDLIFVCDMGDIFSPNVRDEWVMMVLEYVSRFPDKQFLFLTKNPERYKDFLDIMPSNAILGATIETNKDELYVRYRISNAPIPSKRYKAMRDVKWDKKFVSVEPILEFDLEPFVAMIEDIKPILVYVGYDNYSNKLPEPPLWKTNELINRLREFTTVKVKTLRNAWYE